MLENSRVHSRNNTLFYYIEALDFANTKGLAVACTAALGLPNLNWDWTMVTYFNKTLEKIMYWKHHSNKK